MQTRKHENLPYIFAIVQSPTSCHVIKWNLSEKKANNTAIQI